MTSTEEYIFSSIGIRVTPTKIHYCILKQNGENGNLIQDTIAVPKFLELPRRLSILRTMLFSLLKENNIKNAGLRLAEGNAQNISTERLYIEGVFQELLADSTVDFYNVYRLSSFAKLLKMKQREANIFLGGKENVLDIEESGRLNKEDKEALLSAILASQITSK